VKIPLPQTPRWLDHSLTWINASIYSRGKIELRRIDVVLALAFVGCVAYYWAVAGWIGALQGGAIYLMVALIALWML
jgi:hypothetical protein